MTAEMKTLFALTGLVAEAGATVRLAERQDASQAEIWAQLMDRTYDKPFVVDDAANRSLCFSIDGSIQSEMRIADPTALVSDYTRTMMAFLLFCPQPRHIVMLGLGGGSLVKFCRRHLPATRLTVVEIDGAVITLRTHFMVPPDDELLRVVHEDGGNYVAAVARSGECIDVLLADAYDRDGLAPSTADRAFFENATAVLGDAGIFVMNLAAYESEPSRVMPLIRQAFGEPVIASVVGWGGNTVVFAGPALRKGNLLASIQARSTRLRQELDLDLDRLTTRAVEQLTDAP
jgi:spermidine synthase